MSVRGGRRHPRTNFGTVYLRQEEAGVDDGGAGRRSVVMYVGKGRTEFTLRDNYYSSDQNRKCEDRKSAAIRTRAEKRAD